ncbi:MAG: hypothetical protein Q4G21_06885 [Dermabacter sp.]|nr:hypothetical protein [Dermabacter sp.]
MASSDAKEMNTKALRRAFVIAVIVGVVLDLVLIAVAVAVGDARALNGALVGTGFALIATLPTLITAFWGLDGGFAALATSVLGTWVIKMFALIIAVLVVQGATWLSTPWVGIALLVGAVVPTVVEIGLLIRTRPRLEV